MSSIFAPGNPEMFYGKYMGTLEFLEKIEKKLDDDRLVQQFRSGESYKKFQTRWNLPVYFQIRFQEIGSVVESVCSKSISKSVDSSSTGFQLNQFQVSWHAIEKCWQDGIFLSQIFVKFWKLTLQILARLSCWIDTTLKLTNFEGIGMTRVDYLVELYADTVHLLSRFPEILTMAKRDPSYSGHLQLLDSCLGDTKSIFSHKLEAIEVIFQQELLNQCQPYIKHASDIPRLYRKTNKDVPTKPCAYVEHMSSPLRVFCDNYTGRIGDAKIKRFYTKICSSLTVQYSVVVEDVLVSVQKTEESLRRLKNLREKSNTNLSGMVTSTASAISDDDKIRTQLLVDVTCWRGEIEKLGLSGTEIEKLGDLISLVDGAANKAKN